MTGAEVTLVTHPWQVLVVVPARNEEVTLAACLGSIDRAVDNLRLTRPAVGVRVVVVLDSCTDRSAEVLARFAHVTGVVVGLGRVGATRAAGVLAAREAGLRHPAQRTWLASTDADGEVPGDWLTGQLDRADRGAHAVVGMVQPQRGLPEPLRMRWHALHPAREDHDHVHGANLGIRLDHYDAVGGFEPLEEHEDVRLVERLEESGARLVRTAAGCVTTSSRRLGRTPGGFAAYLGLLQDQQDRQDGLLPDRQGRASVLETLPEVITRAAG